MATNMIYKYDEKQTRVQTLAATVAPGVPLIDPNDARPAVSITASGDYVITETENLPFGWTSVTGIAKGGAGLVGKETTLAYDGTWEFAVTGATTATADGAQVYITSGGALTTTSGGNTAFGRVDYPIDYLKVDGVLPVRIGD